MEFFDASPEALSKTRKIKYPWDSIPVGKSYTFADNEVKFGTLRSMASKMGKKLGKTFKVVHHVEHKVYEIACVGIVEDE